MTRSIFDNGFRPSLGFGPRMGISFSEMKNWWTDRYKEYETATGGPAAATKPMPYIPPPPPAGPNWLLVGGAVVLVGGVAAAVYFSQKAK